MLYSDILWYWLETVWILLHYNTIPPSHHFKWHKKTWLWSVLSQSSDQDFCWWVLLQEAKTSIGSEMWQMLSDTTYWFECFLFFIITERYCLFLYCSFRLFFVVGQLQRHAESGIRLSPMKRTWGSVHKVCALSLSVAWNKEHCQSSMVKY